MWLLCAIAIPALALTLHGMASRIPPSDWSAATFYPDAHSLRDVIFQYSVLPRISVSILAGAALGLSGTLFQQVLRNPMAEPTTFGTAAGAQLALMAATLYAPWLMEAVGRETIAMTGAALATVIVFALAWRSRLSPIALIISGLLVGLLAGACGGLLTLFHNESLQSIFIWSTGALNQDGWGNVTYLLPRLASAAILSVLLVRPLSIMALDDEASRSLGLPLPLLRFLVLSIAVGLAASIVSAVGVIGFVGLAAPALGRLGGARRTRDRLLWSPILGASLLWLTDQLLQLPGAHLPDIPTGTATALLSAPMLLWLAPSIRGAVSPPRTSDPDRGPRLVRPAALLAFAFLLLCVLTWFALGFGRDLQGWHFLNLGEAGARLEWRWPRVCAALAAGAMLATGGVLMQRLTGNAMASPEVLGISSGATLGTVLLIFVAPFAGRLTQIAAASIGALTVLIAILILGRASKFSPDRLLLVGIALGSLLSAIVAVLIASGDPRMGALLAWMAGSTYRVTGEAALAGIGVAIAGLAMLPMTLRWLAILPLGEQTSLSIGLNLAWSRLLLLLLTALFTGSATLIVGPLSFIGLLSPQLARLAGFRRPAEQIAAAAICGAFIMVGADWAGRNLLFPYQVPAGLLASVIGSPVVAWLLRAASAR